MPAGPKDGFEATRETVLALSATGVDYIHRWTAEHGTRGLLDEIRASIPPLD